MWLSRYIYGWNEGLGSQHKIKLHLFSTLMGCFNRFQNERKQQAK